VLIIFDRSDLQSTAHWETYCPGCAWPDFMGDFISVWKVQTCN